MVCLVWFDFGYVVRLFVIVWCYYGGVVFFCKVSECKNGSNGYFIIVVGGFWLIEFVLV